MPAGREVEGDKSGHKTLIFYSVPIHVWPAGPECHNLESYQSCGLAKNIFSFVKSNIL